MSVWLGENDGARQGDMPSRTEETRPSFYLLKRGIQALNRSPGRNEAGLRERRGLAAPYAFMPALIAAKA